MEKFNICVLYKAKSGKAREAFVKELTELGVLKAIRAENGCLKYEYFNSFDDETSLVLYEEWLDKSCQEEHMKQPHMEIAMQVKAKYIDRVEIKQIKIL